MPRKISTIRYYSLHGRTKEGPIDYAGFFQGISDLPITDRVIQVTQQLTIAIERVIIQGNVIQMRLSAGNPNENPLVFDPEQGQSIPAEIRRGQWAATPVRVAIFMEQTSRVVSMEIRQGGVGAINFERLLVKIADRNGSKIRFDLTPIPGESFSHEISEYERIRVASIEIARPNFDWDDFSEPIYEAAGESGAGSAIAEMKARRGESLNTSGGLVGFLKRLSEIRNTSVKDAKITGTRKNEDTETTVSLERHNAKTSVSYRTEVPQTEQDEIVWAASLEEMAKIHGKWS